MKDLKNKIGFEDLLSIFLCHLILVESITIIAVTWVLARLLLLTNAVQFTALHSSPVKCTVFQSLEQGPGLGSQLNWLC